MDFVGCINTARGRVSNKENWYDLYDLLRVRLPPDAESQQFVSDLQHNFDIRFEKNVVRTPEDCLQIFPQFTEEDIPPER